MARARLLSKSLGCSRRFNALLESHNGLAEFAQLLYAMLIPHADDFGRLTGDPFSVRLMVMPASPRPVEDFADAIRALHDVDLVTVYEIANDLWIQINKFDE